MKKYLIVCILAVCGFAALLNASGKKDIDLFVLSGQSNAVGWMGDARKYPPDPHKLDSRIPFYCVTPGVSPKLGEWTTLGPQDKLGPAGHFGPEVTLARELLRHGMHPAFFKYSIGASSIAKDWKGPGDNGWYDKMVKEYKKAVKELEDQGYNVHERCFIWIQGESDGETKEMADAFKGRLLALVNDWRNNVVKNKNLPIILGVDEQHPYLKKNPQVVKAHQEIAAADKNIIFTSMIGLEKADGTHLKPAGLVNHGKRLFDAYKKLVKQNLNSKRIEK